MMDPFQAADALVAEFERPGAPGGVAAVTIGGEPIWSCGFGLADLATGAPFRADTPFHICSITKTFTATLLGLLEADGVLSIGEDVREHLPNFPDYETPVTLRHLVTNTAGLRDYFPLMFLESGRMRQSYPREPLERHSLAQPTLMFRPGSRFSYSNSNFVALCRAIEAASGETYAALLEEKIFGPLGMVHSAFRTQTVPEPEGAALGYFADGDQFRAPRLEVYEAGDGGIWSTASDMALYGAALAAGSLGPAGMIERLTRPTRLESGGESWYACGFGTGERGGAAWFGHAGGLSGMSTNLVCFPAQNAAVIAALNGPAGDAEDFSLRLADTFLGLQPPPRRIQASTAAPTDLAGCWQDEVAGVTAEITSSGGHIRLWLMGWDIALTATDEDRLYDAETASEVRRLPDDRIEVRAGRGTPVILSRVDPEPTEAPDGRFEGLEVRAIYEISHGALVVHGPAGASPSFGLKPAARNVWHVLRPGDAATSGVVISRREDGDLVVSMSKAEGVRLRRLA